MNTHTKEMFPKDPSNLPLPLIVAESWQFPLAFHIVDGQHLYAIQDWVRGLTGLKKYQQCLGQFQKTRRMESDSHFD